MDLRERVARGVGCGPGRRSGRGAVRRESGVGRIALMQRRRETGSLAPRKQTKFRAPRPGRREEERLAALITARPDATLTELRDALPTTAALSTLWRDDRSLGLHRQKKRYTPTNNVGLMSPRRAASGGRGSRCATCAQYVFLDECGVTTDLLRRYGRSPLRHAPPRSHARAATGRRTPSWPRCASTASARRPCSTARSTTPTFLAYVEQVLVPDAAPGRCRRARQPRGPQTTRGPRRHRSTSAPSCAFCRPTVPTSIRSNWPSPN